MKKLVLGLTIASALGLTGCKDAPKEPVVPDGTSTGGTALTKVLYSASTGELPVPNDLLFGERDGVVDLTLDFPAADYSDFSNPLVAVGSLDGWSATAPFAISLINEQGVDVDPATIIPGVSVKVYETNVYRPEAVPDTGIPVPTGPVTSIVRELDSTDFVATYGGPLSIAILPLKPLTPQASYMVVVTNDLLDANGNAVAADVQYTFAKGSETLEGDLAALEPVRQLVNAMEAAAGTQGVAKEDIVVSFQFTVQSIGNVVATTKQVYIDGPFLNPSYVPYTSFSSLFTDTTPFTGLGAADLHKGEFGLTYFLTAPTAENPLSVVNDFFRGAANIPDGQGGSFPNPFAGGVTTYANPLVAATGSEIVPLLVSMPKATLGCSKPAAGYPVMIFQHGITANRTNMLGIADSMAAPPSCTAVVAMDLPIHGIAEDNAVHQGLQLASGGLIGIFEDYDAGSVRERTFGVDYVNNETGAPGPDGTPDASGAHTINLSNLLVSRDNGRQAILDLLALEKAVPYMDIDGDTVPDFDPANIKFMGHSLGGIVGTGFLGHSDLVESAVLANPSGGVALMINDSPAFGPTVRAGLAAAGVEAGTPLFAQFMFATQTAIDSFDPASTSQFALANNIPTLMIQASNDLVISNVVAGAPQSGTTPLAGFLGLENVSVTEAGPVAGERLFSRFNPGGHGSVLSPAENLEVTAEMQSQIVQFLGSPSGAKGFVVQNPSVLISD